MDSHNSLKISSLVLLSELSISLEEVIKVFSDIGTQIKFFERTSIEFFELSREDFFSISSNEITKRNIEIIFSTEQIMFTVEFIAVNQYYTTQNLVNMILSSENINLKSGDLIIKFLDSIKVFFAFFFDSEYEDTQDLDKLVLDNNLRIGIYFLKKDFFNIEFAKKMYSSEKIIYFYETKNLFILSDLKIVLGSSMNDFLKAAEVSQEKLKAHKESLKELLKIQIVNFVADKPQSV